VLRRTGAGPPGCGRVGPYLPVGTVDEIVAQLENARRRWGISYLTIRDGDAFTPVLRALRAA